jgi:hypothetical protein
LISDFFPGKSKNALKERLFFLKKQVIYQNPEQFEMTSTVGTFQPKYLDDTASQLGNSLVDRFETGSSDI